MKEESSTRSCESCEYGTFLGEDRVYILCDNNNSKHNGHVMFEPDPMCKYYLKRSSEHKQKILEHIQYLWCETCNNNVYMIKDIINHKKHVIYLDKELAHIHRFIDIIMHAAD